MGGTIFIHCFGAYFGLGVDFILGKLARQETLSESSQTSNLLSLIGRIYIFQSSTSNRKFLYRHTFLVDILA